MTRREIRNEIFKLLFENELSESDLDSRIQDIILEEKLSKEEEIKFLKDYTKKIVSNSEEIEKEIKKELKGWTYERLGTVEKVLLKMSFYEILFEKIGYEIAINEVVELSKVYGDPKTKEFINGILAKLVKDK